MFALSLNTLLSYGLIFGNFGLPRLGVLGAAVGALSARLVECATYLWVIYRRKSPIAATPRQLLSFDRVFVFFIGISNASAILIGNRIGAGEEDKAYDYAARALALVFLGSLVLGALIYFTAGQVLTLYKVSPSVVFSAQAIFHVMAFTLWIRMSNMVTYVGILRSGGDTRFAFLMDVGIMWMVGVPLAFLGAFVIELPVYWVYLLILTEEMIKWVIGLYRFRSRRWINNLAHSFN
jgi:Na+-driven multidrug efflux pump